MTCVFLNMSFPGHPSDEHKVLRACFPQVQGPDFTLHLTHISHNCQFHSAWQSRLPPNPASLMSPCWSAGLHPRWKGWLSPAIQLPSLHCLSLLDCPRLTGVDGVPQQGWGLQCLLLLEHLSVGSPGSDTSHEVFLCSLTL